MAVGRAVGEAPGFPSYVDEQRGPRTHAESGRSSGGRVRPRTAVVAVRLALGGVIGLEAHDRRESGWFTRTSHRGCIEARGSDPVAAQSASTEQAFPSITEHVLQLGDPRAADIRATRSRSSQARLVGSPDSPRLLDKRPKTTSTQAGRSARHRRVLATLPTFAPNCVVAPVTFEVRDGQTLHGDWRRDDDPTSRPLPRAHETVAIHSCHRSRAEEILHPAGLSSLDDRKRPSHLTALDALVRSRRTAPISKMLAMREAFETQCSTAMT